MIPQIGLRMTILQKIKIKEETLLDHRDASATTITDITITDVLSSDGNDTNRSAEPTSMIIYEEDILRIIKSSYEDFDLKTLLLTSPLGKSILTYYKTYNKLDNTRRNRLVSIIVKHLYNYIVKNRLRQEEYNSLAAKIVLLFPTEPMGLYYCPPIKKSISPHHKPVTAKGKLVNHCRNILFKSGDTTKQRQSQDEDNNDGVVPNKCRRLNFEDDHKEEITWLEHNTEPWEKVIEYWNKTYEVRSSSDGTTVSEYLKQWPVLNDLRSPVLINLDFEKKYSCSQVAFDLNWENFMEGIISYKKDEITDSAALSLLTSLAALTDKDEKLPLRKPCE